MLKDSLSLTKDLAWPWTAAPAGPWLLAGVALLLAGLTVWTYQGATRSNHRRLTLILGLRLFALLLACLMILRPSVAFRESAFLPSSLLIVLDSSESMSIRDEFGNKSRWEALQHWLREAEPELDKLRDEQEVGVVFHQFAEDARELDPKAQPAGKRTDFGQMFQTLLKTHGRERNVRGMILLSDGADNGTRFSSLAEAARWRTLPCPINTFGVGKQTTSDRQRDIALTSINPEPSPVPVKGKLSVRVTLDAPGFENAPVTLRLFLDDKEVLAAKETLRKTSGNEVMLVADAPAEPREIKVTLKVDPLQNELSLANNEISTYVTVTREGISVLLVDRLRVEQAFIRHALKNDPRIRLYVAERVDDQPHAAQADLFQFDKQHYDVILIGDVSAGRFSGGDPRVLERIHDLVKDKGTGLLMMGGNDSFGNSDWNPTPVARLLPVDLHETGQVDEPVKMEPTRKALSHYVLRLVANDRATEDLWKKLPELDGMTRLGRERPGATVLATRAGSDAPVLVFQKYGAGRTLAFAGDTTWRWLRLGQPKSTEGLDAHARFWKNVVLFLAKQDELDGNVRVEPDARRLPAGSKLGFSVRMVGKGGVDVKAPKFDVAVVGPNKAETVVQTAQDMGVERGLFWKTDAPGEYRLQVRGRGVDADGKEIVGQAVARFLIYQDDAEMARRAADHDFLNKLAHAGGGKFHLAQELPDFLRKMQQAPTPQNNPKTELWPDWRRSTLSGFLVGLYLLFVTVLCLEWLLRRSWGLV